MNFSDLIRVELSGGAVQTDTPGQKFFAYLDWRPIPQLSLVPNVAIQSKKWLQGAVNNLLYYRGGSFTLLGLKASYNPIEKVTIELGATNLADRNYNLPLSGLLSRSTTICSSDVSALSSTGTRGKNSG